MSYPKIQTPIGSAQLKRGTFQCNFSMFCDYYHRCRHTGQWIVFTGDQLGAVFAAQALERYKASGKPIEKLAMVASTVSSKMIEAMAGREGFKFVECLTG